MQTLLLSPCSSLKKTCNIHLTDILFFFRYKETHFTLISFMQIQDIEIIFHILSLAFLSNILNFCYK